MSERLRQVALERRTDKGVQVDVAWIDADLARRGKRVRILDSDQIWTIVDVYGERRREFVESNRAAQKHFEEVSNG
jgi:hypothetical protein